MTYIAEITKKMNSGEMNLIFKAKILYFLDQYTDSTINNDSFLNEASQYLKSP